MSRVEFCKYVSRVIIALFGLTHTGDTKVGDDFVRGVSGGERKRVSLAEMVLAGSPFAAWDNRYLNTPHVQVTLLRYQHPGTRLCHGAEVR
jgi:hypothetical protein